MRALIQHVSEAYVEVDGETVGEIGRGLLVFLGVMKDDTEQDMNSLLDKITNPRLFKHIDETGKEKYFDKSILDIQNKPANSAFADSGITADDTTRNSSTTPGVLVVSQFTLCANTNNGRRPSFDNAAPPSAAKEMYNKFVQRLRSVPTASGQLLNVAEGKFQAMMHVHLVNEGPITIMLDSR